MNILGQEIDKPFPKDTTIIYYIWWAKGHGLKSNKHTFYCAERNGDVVNYQTKKQLIKESEEAGFPWMVVRHKKKGGKISIVEKSKQ